MISSAPHIVISGAGMVTPLGLTRRQTWDAVLRGQCGCGAMSAMEQPLAAGRDGGQAPDLPGQTEPGTPREVRYLRKALHDAIADAGFADGKLPYPPERCGLMIGTTLHGMRAGGQFLRTNDFDTLRNFLASSTLRAAARNVPAARKLRSGSASLLRRYSPPARMPCSVVPIISPQRCFG